MDWPSTTTRQTHTKGPKYFYQNFCGHHPYPYLKYTCFWWYWVHYKKSFIFSVDCMQITCGSYDTTETTEKYLSGRKFSPKFFYILMNVNPTISPNFVEIGGLLFFCPFPRHPLSMDLMDCICWNLSVSVLYGSIQDMWCVAGLIWILCWSQTHPKNEKPSNQAAISRFSSQWTGNL